MATAEKPKTITNSVNTESAGLGISGSNPSMANGETKECSDSEETAFESGFTVVAESPSTMLGVTEVGNTEEGSKGEDKVVSILF